VYFHVSLLFVATPSSGLARQTHTISLSLGMHRGMAEMGFNSFSKVVDVRPSVDGVPFPVDRKSCRDSLQVQQRDATDGARQLRCRYALLAWRACVSEHCLPACALPPSVSVVCDERAMRRAECSFPRSEV